MAKQFIPSAVGKSHPETMCTCEISVILNSDLFYGYEQLSPYSWDVTRGAFQALLNFQLITLTLKAH